MGVYSDGLPETLPQICGEITPVYPRGDWVARDVPTWTATLVPEQFWWFGEDGRVLTPLPMVPRIMRTTEGPHQWRSARGSGETSLDDGVEELVDGHHVGPNVLDAEGHGASGRKDRKQGEENHRRCLPQRSLLQLLKTSCNMDRLTSESLPDWIERIFQDYESQTYHPPSVSE